MSILSKPLFGAVSVTVGLCAALIASTWGAVPVPTETVTEKPATTTVPVTVPLVRTTLPNGIRIVCRQETDTPLVAIDAFVRVGATQESSDSAGLASYVARTLLASTSTNTPEQMTVDINALGGNVNVSRQPDWTQISVLTVSDQFSDAAQLVDNALTIADFDADAVKQAREDILSDQDTTTADLFETAYRGVRLRLYGNSSYALPPLGSPDTVRHLTRDALIRFYQRYYTPKNIVFVVVGNIDPQDAIRTISQQLDSFPTQGRGSRWSEPDPTPLALPVQDFAPYQTTAVDLSQTAVMVGYHTAPMSSPDYPALLVANALLGGMKSSRMFTNLREKQGLSYELGSFYTAKQLTGELVAFAFVEPQRQDELTKKTVSSTPYVEREILKLIDTMKNVPPTAAELARAQHFLIGSYKIKHERLEDRTTLLGIAELSAPGGASFDTEYAHYINSVTIADVQRVAAKYFVHPAISIVEPDPKEGGAKNE